MRAQIGSTPHARPNVVATDTDESLASGSVGDSGYIHHNAVDYGNGPDSICERDMIVGSVTQEGFYPFAEPSTPGLEDNRASLTFRGSIAPTAGNPTVEMYERLAAAGPLTQFSTLETCTHVGMFEPQRGTEQPYAWGENCRPAPPPQNRLAYAHAHIYPARYVDPTESWASGTQGNPPRFSPFEHGSSLQPSYQPGTAQMSAFEASACNPQPSLPTVPIVPSNHSRVLLTWKPSTATVAPSTLWLAHLQPASEVSHTTRDYREKGRRTKEARLRRALRAAAEARATVDDALKSSDFADTFNVPGQPRIRDRMNALIDAFVIADTEPSAGRKFDNRKDKDNQRQTFTRGVINLVKSLARETGSGTLSFSLARLELWEQRQKELGLDKGGGGA